MSCTNLTRALVAAFLVVSSLNVSAAPKPATDEAEVAALLERAGDAFDLEREDAIFLLDELSETWTTDGRLVRSIHQIALIRTEYGLDHYADLRVPWDSARQCLVLQALRTWRPSDDQWIDAGPTASVETLPFAVDRSPDYCHLRETMLLHDGVELPCVMETRYTIEDQIAFRPGFSGTRHLWRPEPTVVSRLVLGGPAAAPPRWALVGGVSAPVEGRDEATGLSTWTFELSDVPAEPSPASADSHAGLPQVSWSSWPDYAALGRDLLVRLDAAATLDEALEKRLSEHLDRARTPLEKAARVASLIAEGTRFVDVEPEWWAAPRPAVRTWSTAYANPVDRTTLAAALFRAAGFEVELGFVGAGFLAPGHDLPTLDWSDGPSLSVGYGEGLEAWFDPRDASLSMGEHAFLGRFTWFLVDESPTFWPVGLQRPSRKTLHLDLAIDESASSFEGSGALVADGILSPFHRMCGTGTEAIDALDSIVGSLLGGATVTAYNPETFDPMLVSVCFDVETPLGERDRRGRLICELAPFAELLPGDLHEEHRQGAVHLPGSLEYSLELRLDPGELAVVRHPLPRELENEAGRFEIVLRRGAKPGSLRLIRRLTLNKASYRAEEWPQLRALLLASADRAGRVFFFE